jgi:hypothetical protein
MMAGRKDDDESLPAQAQDLWKLVVGYAKQETLDPIRGLGRFVGCGVGAALCGSLGVVLLLLGGLRFLQTETGSAFEGRKSFLPYLIVLIVSGAVAGGALKARTRGQRKDAK